MTTQRAKFNTRTARLSDDFGEQMARKWFGDEAVDALPKYVRGKNKGKPKGFYIWTKVEEGGWVNNMHCDGGGYVENRRGAIIERKLCELNNVSSNHGYHGVAPGKVLHQLGQNETLQEQAERRARRERVYHADQMAEALEGFRTKMAVVAQLRRGLLDPTNEHHDAIRGIIPTFQEEAREYLLDLEAATADYRKLL